MDWLPISSTEHMLRFRVRRMCEDWCLETGEFRTPTINITVDELLERYAAGERNFVDICLPEKSDLTGVNLSGAILLGSNLSSINFTNANLTNCDLRHCWLTSSNFTKANLEGANIDRADVGGSKFKQANLFNTVGSFGMECGALFEDTVMRNGSIKSYEGRA